MKKFILTIACILALSPPAWADDLGCFENGNTVYATVQFNGATGESAATSVTARVYDPDDTTTPSHTPTMSAVDGTNAVGLYRGSFTLSSPLAGTWTIRYRGSLDGGTSYVTATDTFVVKASCPLPATTAVTLPSIPANWITSAGIATGALAKVATGTENGSQVSTATRVYTAISNNTRRYMSMCLENASTGERSKITGYGSSPANYFDVRGFSAAVGDSVTLNVYEGGCN